MDSTKRTINGKWGEIWLDDNKVAEIKGFQAKVSFNKAEINICGNMLTDSKVLNAKGTGSLRMYKVYSRMANAIGDAIRNGKDLRFTITSKLADPDAYGSERVVIKNVSFDDLTLADWQDATVGEVEAPFTFTDYRFLDTIDV